MEGKLSDTALLEGNADYSVRGDWEYLMRVAYRSVGLAQWKS